MIKNIIKEYIISKIIIKYINNNNKYFDELILKNLILNFEF